MSDPGRYVFDLHWLLAPVESVISKRVSGDICQEVCPWNVRSSKELPKDSPFASRDMLSGKDARRLARDLLAMTQQEFSGAFKGSPMKRAKLHGLKRNAAVVLGNSATAAHAEGAEIAELLSRALEDAEPLLRDHAAWALSRLCR